MARTDSERLTILKSTRDSLEDALFDSTGDALVVSYTTQDGRSVERSREQVQREIDSLDKRIAKLELNTNGPATNRLQLRRRP